VVLFVGAITLVDLPNRTDAAGGFSPNQRLELPNTGGKLPVTFIVRGLEPSIRVAPDGAVYVSSIRGVPTGVDLHRYYAPIDGAPAADGTYAFKYEGRPDGCGILATGCDLIGIAEGGGDVDIAVNYPTSGVPNLALTSLTLAPGITATHSTNRGDTFTNPNPAAALVPIDDRQWMDGFGPNKVYLAYHDVGTFQIEVQRSGDGGQTYLEAIGEVIDPVTMLTAGGIPTSNSANVHAGIRVDRSSCSSRGNLYQLFIAPETPAENATIQPLRSVYVGVSTDVKLGLAVFTFTVNKIWTGPVGSRNENIFPSLAVDGRGYVYAVWSNRVGSGAAARYTMYYSFSKDLGTTWAPAIAVNRDNNPKVFPWIEAEADGHVGIVWFEGDRSGDSNDATIHEPGTGPTAMTGWTNWSVRYAESLNGHAAAPTFSQVVISDHVIHRGTVSTGGLGGAANRNLGDYFQIAFDPQHRANVAFSDDHELHPTAIAGHPGYDDPQARRLIRAYFTHQLRAPDVQTGDACAGTGVRPPEDDEDTGEGTDEGGDDVHFVDRHDPSTGRDNGALLFNDPSKGLTIRSSNGVGGIRYNGRCVSFAGDARVNGQLGYQLAFTGCDIANPGAGFDTFSLDVTGPSFAYHKAGTLKTGDIHLHFLP
jgi:hypothetical protein